MIQATIKYDARRSVYIGEKGTLKVGSRGKATSPKAALAPLSKGERRKIRKGLRAAGRTDLVQATL